MPDPIQGVNTTTAVAPASTAATSQANANVAASTAESVTANTTDVSDVTQTEALLLAIVQAASELPNIDQTKIATLQQAIASGAYQANPQSIAQKIAELETLLGTAGQVQ